MGKRAIHKTFKMAVKLSPVDPQNRIVLSLL